MEKILQNFSIKMSFCSILDSIDSSRCYSCKQGIFFGMKGVQDYNYHYDFTCFRDIYCLEVAVF